MKIIDWYDYVQNPKEHTVTGYMKIIENFHMPQFDRCRRIWVYLPPHYDQSEDRYPVLYMHDGQNLFDRVTSYSGEWHVDESMNRLCHGHKTRGAIVVGIDNGGTMRLDEYIPNYQGYKYLDFIVDTLKPFIDQTFRTLPDRLHTGTAGSSLGGLISLYMAFKRPDVFSKIGAFSPSMSFAEDCLYGWAKQYDMKIYLDVGTNETLPYNSSHKYAQLVMDTYHQLIGIGFRHDELQLILDEGGTHNEADWARRFPEAFLWLFA